MKNRAFLKREINYSLFLIPALAGYVVFYVIPVISSFYYSVTNISLFTKSASFIGLDNYLKILGDEQILIGIKNSFIYAVMMTIFQNGLAIPLAVALDAKLKTRNLLRMIFFAPAVFSSLVIGYLWSYIMAPTDYGILNQAIMSFGFPKVNWLGEPGIALYSIILCQVWQWVGWAMVIYLANLQSILPDYYEAARIDGANGLQAFCHITFPMLAPSLTVNSVLSMIGGLKVFDSIFAMTQGGPGYSTTSITLVLIQRGFTEGLYGYASAIAVLLFVIIAVLSLIQLHFLQKREEKIV